MASVTSLAKVSCSSRKNYRVNPPHRANESWRRDRKTPEISGNKKQSGGGSNKATKLRHISSATKNYDNQQHTQQQEGHHQKALVVDQQRHNLLQRYEQWAQPAVILDKTEPSSPTGSTNACINESASGTPDKDALPQPLLDGGQGENSVFTIAFARPHGYVNADADAGNSPTSFPPNKEERHQPNHPFLHNGNAVHGQLTSVHAHQPNGSTMGQTDTSVTNHLEGLLPPIIEATGEPVAGRDIEKLRLQNKRQRHALQEQQEQTSVWTIHQGDEQLPTPTPLPETWRGDMCPSGIATSHPAGELLQDWSQLGCPMRTGRPWSTAEMWEAVERGPYQSALSSEALDHFATEAIKKVNAGQSRIVEWNSIKDNPPPAKDIAHRSHPAQVTGFLFHPGSILPITAKKQRNFTVGQ
jgi:hypothetical protein